MQFELSKQDKEFVLHHQATLDTPEITDKDSSDVFIIRHAISEFNYRNFLQRADKDPEAYWENLKADTSITDASLHNIGVYQCQVNSPKLSDLNITRVFVSPMERAMQTAIYMFANHKNLAKIKFIVSPLLREWLHTASDMSGDVVSKMERYAPGQPVCRGLVFDFTWLTNYAQPQLWSIISIPNVEKQTRVISQLKNGFQYNDFSKAVMKVLMEVENFEDHFDTFERAKSFTNSFKEYLKSNPLSDGEKVAIVTHSMLISALTCSHVKVDSKGRQHFANAKWMLNCQTIGWNDYKQQTKEPKQETGPPIDTSHFGWPKDYI